MTEGGEAAALPTTLALAATATLAGLMLPFQGLWAKLVWSVRARHCAVASHVDAWLARLTAHGVRRD